MTQPTDHFFEIREAFRCVVAGDPSHINIALDALDSLEEQSERYEQALERIRDWRGFRHTGEVRDCAGEALSGR